MNDCELISAITAIACAITKCFSEDEISIMSVAFTQLGDTLATVQTQREIRENRIARCKEQAEAENKKMGEFSPCKENEKDVEE
jgi:hypothetical protein